MTKFEIISKKQFTQDFVNYTNILHQNLKKPKRATLGSAGYDFFSPISFSLAPGETIKIPTGIRVLLPSNKFLMIVPRSGLGFKYKLQLDNTVGIIDSDYSGSDNEGHIWIKMTNDSRDGKILTVKAGEAIAQGIILKYELTDDDVTEGVRNGGFGSTTK